MCAHVHTRVFVHTITYTWQSLVLYAGFCAIGIEQELNCVRDSRCKSMKEG